MVEVIIKQGTLAGNQRTDYEGNDYFAFQGIPYAKPPVGSLRFKAPEPPDKWDGVLQATHCKSASLQHVLNLKLGSEDCLYVNVYTPRLPCCGKCRLPVMVFIHGGFYLIGSGNEDDYGPDFFLTEMVVLVTFNYRLGLLGFLSLKKPELEVPGNGGLKDAVMCLRWVKENITHFNGDPGNVTIFGSSSGALSVHCLILSPLAKGLFHKAVMQSGSAFCPWAMSQTDDFAFKAASAIGYTGSQEDEAEILKYFSRASEDDVLKAQIAVVNSFYPNNYKCYGPVVEYHSNTAFFTEPPLYIIASNSYNKIPVMIGYNDREGLFIQTVAQMLNQKLQFPINLELFIPAYYGVKQGTSLSQKIVNLLKNYYCNSYEPNESNMENIYILNTDVMFWRGVYLTIKTQASSIPMYLYRFSMDGELNISKKQTGVTMAGASHGDETYHMFKRSDSPNPRRGGASETTMFRIIKLWTTFAKYGDPNPKPDIPLIPVIWDKVDTSNIKCLNIDENLRFQVNPDLSRMDIWDKISEIVAQSTKTKNEIFTQNDEVTNENNDVLNEKHEVTNETNEVLNKEKEVTTETNQ